MADKTGIEWTDATWNPVTGCSKVSQGCKNCYALRDWPRMSANPKTVYYGREFTDVMCHPERLDQPIRWAKPRMIFVNSMSDLFHPDVPFDFIADVFAVMSCTTRHTYQILTKRPQRMLEFFAWLDEEHDGFGHPSRIDSLRVWPQWKAQQNGRGAGYDNCGPAWPLENVWIGVSAEDQATAGERIPLLLKTPAAVRWVSAEPLLGKVELDNIEYAHGDFINVLSLEEWKGLEDSSEVQNSPGSGALIDWVVVGGESGPNARPMHPDWARSLRDQCAVAGVPFLFKQWGEWAPVGPIYSDDDTDEHMAALECDPDEPRQCWISPSGQIEDGGHQPPIGTWAMRRIGKKGAGRLLDGVLHDGYPKDKV